MRRLAPPDHSEQLLPLRSRSDLTSCADQNSEPAAALMERWHEVVVSGLADPKTRERLIIVSQVRAKRIPGPPGMEWSRVCCGNTELAGAGL